MGEEGDESPLAYLWSEARKIAAVPPPTPLPTHWKILEPSFGHREEDNALPGLGGRAKE